MYEECPREVSGLFYIPGVGYVRHNLLSHRFASFVDLGE